MTSNAQLKEVPWWRTQYTDVELNAVLQAIKNEKLSNGPISREFEQKFAEILGVPYAVVVPNGTLALTMVLLTKNIGPGDECIVCCRTWISPAHAPLILGAKTVLIDCLSKRPVIDCQQIENQITEKTKAIIAVHFNGRSADMKAINHIAKKHHLFVIEDGCQSFLSQNLDGYLGTQSNAGCFSLGVSKLISTGQGGVIVTRNQQFYEELLLVRNNGMENILVPNYIRGGANFKYPDILASIGMVQLADAPRRVNACKKIFQQYKEMLQEFPFLEILPLREEEGEFPIYIEVLSHLRKSIMMHLQACKIQSRVLPPSLHRAPQFGYQDHTFPNSTLLEEEAFYLPSGPDQSQENINRVFDALRFYQKKYT